MTRAEEIVHFISANPDGTGNVTICGKPLVYPMAGNGWRVRDISCPECDRIICDIAHSSIRKALMEREGAKR